VAFLSLFNYIFSSPKSIGFGDFFGFIFSNYNAGSCIIENIFSYIMSIKTASMAIGISACLCAVVPCRGRQLPVYGATATEVINDTTILKTEAHVAHETNVSILAGYSQGV